MPPISLSEIGRWNAVYSDAEQEFIKDVLKTAEADLLRLGTLRSNEGTRRRQLDLIGQCKVALAPHKKVPEELWPHIFELFCLSDQPSIFDTLQPAAVLTHVCSAWRRIGLSMPKLWINVYISENLNLARICLERAGNFPRALMTSTRYFSTHHHRPTTIQGFVCSFPITTLRLTEREASCIFFTEIPEESLLLLEDLAIVKSTGQYTEPSISFFPHRFPNLISIHIGTSTMPRFHVCSPFATWKKLRILRLDCRLREAHCLQILHDASSVEDCSLRLVASHYRGSTLENVVVDNLKILKLSFFAMSILWTFPDRLTVPNLHTLVLSATSPKNFQLNDRLLLLHLGQRIPLLRSLDIHRLYMDADVSVVLDCIPLLQVLTLHGGQMTPHTAEIIGSGELGSRLGQLHDWNPRNIYRLLKICELRRDIVQDQLPNDLGAIAPLARLENVSIKYSQWINNSQQRILQLHKDGIGFKVFQSGDDDVDEREYLHVRSIEVTDYHD